MEALDRAPDWLMRPVPVNALSDEKFNRRVARLGEKLPDRVADLHELLNEVKAYSHYDTAANVAAAHVWLALDRFFADPAPAARVGLIRFTREHLGPEAQARVLRRLVKDPASRVRRQARKAVEQLRLREVALPRERDGDWDTTGWLRGAGDTPLTRHKTGKRAQERHGVPPLANLAALRKLLDVRSPRQLGYFLLASDRDGGPYTTFTIPKSDGSGRTICAPSKQLRWVQRHLLDKVLSQVPAHDAAHGFVPGRSTVTNAAKHRGAKLLLKFDLTDFFPTIHYYRVLGLFASLGYPAGDARFGTDDASKQVAPTLARLCCYTPDPKEWGNAALPQGAPTSPAISNLVSRRLDARLEGLAKRSQGVYTRYADDLTFSFKGTAPDLGRFRWWVDQVCHQEGFFVNQRKFRVIRSSQRQLVTGLVVNDELRVPRDERRRFRAVLHNCRLNGIESQARGRARFAEYLRGFASYVHMVQPDEGAELLREVEELLGPENDPS